MIRTLSAVALLAALTGAATVFVTTAIPTSARATTGGAIPGPSVRELCGIPIVNHFVPACSHGRWEPRQLKTMRCIAGHAPYSGILGVPKVTYWTTLCAKSDWSKW